MKSTEAGSNLVVVHALGRRAEYLETNAYPSTLRVCIKDIDYRLRYFIATPDGVAITPARAPKAAPASRLLELKVKSKPPAIDRDIEGLQHALEIAIQRAQSCASPAGASPSTPPAPPNPACQINTDDLANNLEARRSSILSGVSMLQTSDATLRAALANIEPALREVARSMTILTGEQPVLQSSAEAIYRAVQTRHGQLGTELDTKWADWQDKLHHVQAQVEALRKYSGRQKTLQEQADKKGVMLSHPAADYSGSLDAFAKQLRQLETDLPTLAAAVHQPEVQQALVLAQKLLSHLDAVASNVLPISLAGPPPTEVVLRAERLLLAGVKKKQPLGELRYAPEDAAEIRLPLALSGPRDCAHLTPPELDSEYQQLLEEEAKKPWRKRRWKGKPEVYTLVLEGASKTFKQRLNYTYPGWLIRLCIDNPDYRTRYRLDVSTPTALTAPSIDMTKTTAPPPAPPAPADTTQQGTGNARKDFTVSLDRLKNANRRLAAMPNVTRNAMSSRTGNDVPVPDLNVMNNDMRQVINQLNQDKTADNLRKATYLRKQSVARVMRAIDTFNHSTRIFQAGSFALRRDLMAGIHALDDLAQDKDRVRRLQDADMLAAKVADAERLAREWVSELEVLKDTVENKGKDQGNDTIKPIADEIGKQLAQAQATERDMIRLAAELQTLRQEDAADGTELRNVRAMAVGLLSHFAQVDHNVFYIPVEKEKQYDVTVKFDRVTIVALAEVATPKPESAGAETTAAATTGENPPPPSDTAQVFAAVRYEPTGEDRRASFQVRGFTYFRINLGLAYSTLRPGQFTLAPNDAGAQVITRRGEQNILPMLVLSHYWCGADLREIQPYHRLKTCGWKNMLPTLALGVPLSRNPIENLFVGTLWQPVPGLALMGGVHLGRTWVLQRNFVEGQPPPPVAGQVFDINQVQDQRLRLGYFFGIAITDSIFVSAVSRLAGLNN